MSASEKPPPARCPVSATARSSTGNCAAIRGNAASIAARFELPSGVPGKMLAAM